MDKLKAAISLIGIILYLAVTSEAAKRNPLKNPKICGIPVCETEENKFGYVKGTSFQYSYRSHVKSEFFGTGQNVSEFYISGTVDLKFPKDCEGVLQLSQMTLSEIRPTDFDSMADDYDYDDYGSEPKAQGPLHPKSENFTEALQEYPLRFGFHNGVVEEVCPEDDETEWVLNFKKGILSAFQNTMARFDVDRNATETDISGTCNVAYTYVGTADSNVFILKTKDIATCQNRYKMESALQTTPYNFRENKVIWPFLNSISYCNQSVNNYVFETINCYECHLLVPFSNNGKGAVTISNITLWKTDSHTFDDEEEAEGELISRRSALLFDPNPTPPPTHDEVRSSRNLLYQMCDLGFPNIQRDFIEYFTKFIQTARFLSFNALKQLLRRSGSICTNGKNHFIESLPYIGSTASVNIMVDEMINNRTSREVSQKWLTSLSFLPRPNEDMLRSLYDLTKYGIQKNELDYVLGATSVVHTFCRIHSDCYQNEDVQEILALMESSFENNIVRTTDKREVREKLIVVLKGIGNIGHMTEGFVEKLKTTIVDDETPAEIRVQSILSFRRLHCEDYKDFFLDVYKTFTANSEVRVFSYLQAMRCPDYKSINTIKYVLLTEEVNQVGSYVWSHLTNLAKSASPVKIEAQGLLIDSDLGTKYHMDVRKFSRNFEHSLFFAEYNFGIETDANLIFGTDSYLPRAVSLNFTADLFGESVNFFELSARTEGFEQLVTSIFGPKGPLNSNAVRKKFTFLNKFFDDDVEHEASNLAEDLRALENIRIRRSSNDRNKRTFNNATAGEQRRRRESNYSRNMERAVDKLGYKLKYNYNEPRAVFGFKVFGNDLKHYSLQGVDEIGMAAKSLNIFNQIGTFLSGQDLTYTKSGILFDASYNVPMTSGFPLSIHAFGASSIDIRMKGDLNTFKKPLDDFVFDLNASLKPSVSVDVLTTMSTNAFYTSTGIRVKSNLYSSSEVQSNIKVRRGQLVSVEMKLPQDKNEIFSARSELLVMKDTEEIPQKGIDRRYSNSTCSWRVLSHALGLKVCAEYSVPDISNSTEEYPGLIFCGPMDVTVQLEKADPSVKTFLFEYKKTQKGNQVESSFVFQTTESVVPRLLMANLTRNLEGLNSSMVFRIGNTVHKAAANYHNIPNDVAFNVFFETNGKKSLEVKAELKSEGGQTTIVYYPKIILAINGSTVAGIVGKVTNLTKPGLNQYGINLTFETKKLQANAMGYITASERAYTVKLDNYYRFATKKTENISISAEIADRSEKTKARHVGYLNVNSTAYKIMCFTSKIELLSLLGHMEATITLNNSPNLTDPRFDTTIRGIFKRSAVDDIRSDGLRTALSFEVKRPVSHVDFKMSFQHEERSKGGPGHTFDARVRYASDREASAVFSVHFPRRELFAVDASANITIPSFDSCVAKILIMEKKKRDYLMNFNGAWFSGHSMKIKGTYQDNSSKLKSYHRMKLFVTSPHFNDTLIKLEYRRSFAEIYFNILADYDKAAYGAKFNYTNREEHEKSIFVEGRYRDQVYAISTKLLTQQGKELFVELHLDKIRDIHLTVRGLITDEKKEGIIEVKWDANRDPSKRLALDVKLNNPEDSRYDADLSFTYPERTFSCVVDIYTGGPTYQGTGRVSWSANETIVLIYDAGVYPDVEKKYWLNVILTTPFEGWFSNSLNTIFVYKNNLLQTNATAKWADSQSLEVGFMGDYESKEQYFLVTSEIKLSSTIPDIPILNFFVLQNTTSDALISELRVKYKLPNETMQIYTVNSKWQSNFNDFFKNISGNVDMTTPFEGYKTGAMRTKFSLSRTRHIVGAANLKFENKKYTLILDGHVRKLTDNKLAVNITTPIEKFKTITGRFGINERERHAVAEVRAPAGALGVEAILELNSFSDFNVKFSLATPLEAFKDVLLVGKMKPETVDMRGGWNMANLGFTGVWRMTNLTDFEYSYKVLTPIEHFEDNGVVIKLVHGKDLDLEAFGKVSKYKLGVKLHVEHKPKLIAQLTVPYVEDLEEGEQVLGIVAKDEEVPPNEDDESDDSDNNEDEEEEDYDILMNYIGYMELDTLAFPTIKIFGDLEEVKDDYILLATVELPQGTISIKDKFHFPDYLTMNNYLKIHTPFKTLEEIKSRFIFQAELYKYYIAGLEVSGLYMGKWTEIGYNGSYVQSVEESESKVHTVYLTLKSPFEVMKRIDFYVCVDTDENAYRGNFTAKTNRTYLSLAGSMEKDDNYIDGSLGLKLQTDIVPNYAFKVYFKKDYSEVENSVDFGFDIVDDDISNKFRVETMWHIDQSDYVNLRGRLHTNIIPMRLAETTFLLKKHPHLLTSMDIAFFNANNERMLFHAGASRKQNIVKVELATPIEQFRNVTLQGSLVPLTTADKYEIKGNLYRNAVGYNVKGVLQFESDLPVEGQLYFEPKAGGPSSALEFFIRRTEGDYGRTFELSTGDRQQYCKIAGGYSIRSHLDWDFALHVQSSEREVSRIKIVSNILPRENNQLGGKFDLETPWKHLGLESVKLEGFIDFDEKRVESKYEFGHLVGETRCAAAWVEYEDMEFNVYNIMKRNGQTTRSLDSKFKYYNPAKSFKDFNVVGKINVDDIWVLGVNGSVAYISLQNFSMDVISELPQPVGDTHRIKGQYFGDFLTSIFSLLQLQLSYNSDMARKMMLLKADYEVLQKGIETSGRVQWGPNKDKDATDAYLEILNKDKVQKELFLRVATPMYDEDTLHARINYGQKDIYHSVQGALQYPASKQIGDADINFSSISNMYGHVNCTIPLFNITWLNGDFDFQTTGTNFSRYLKATWPTDFALFDMKSTFKSERLNRDTKGTITMDVPFKTRHIAKIKYGVEEREKLTTGDVNVVYNKEEVLRGHYKCETESRAGYAKDKVNIALENQWKPIGIFYTHTRHYVDEVMPDLDIKHIELFQLHNSSVFNITGEFHVKTTENGQSFKVIAIHPNRTVILDSEYHQEGIVYNTMSKLQLAPNVWIGYKIDMKNLTTITDESQSFVVDVFYPKRNLTTEGWYSVTANTFDANLIFNWTQSKSSYYTPSRKQMRAGISWKEDPNYGFDGESQKAVLTLGHPSFKKDITITSLYSRSKVDLLKAEVVVNYNNDPDHIITLKGVVRDLSEQLGYRNYSYEVHASHPESYIRLDASGSVGIKKSIYKTESMAEYVKKFQDPQIGYFLSLVDIEEKLVHYYKISPEKTVRYMIQPHIDNAIYGLNLTFWDSPDTNTSGYFYVDFDKKYTRMDFNLSSDASHNLQMIGFIPDKRSAYFDMWRNYEEIRVVDIAYYLRMNHSRLITSHLKWRPKLKTETKKAFKDFATSFYDSFSDSIDFLIKTIYAETTTAANEMWEVARDDMGGFLNDFKELTVLEDDLNEFRKFLNESYEANDFYIKTVVNFTLTSIDELAFKDHIESLPKIFAEIWQIMGDSGKAIGKSIQWLIETLKTSYHNALDVISKFLHGDSLEHISKLLQMAVEKYDKLVKDLHLSLTKHVENLWMRFSDVISNYWKSLLKKIEPLVFKFLHYIETAVWTFSQDVLGFINQRTNELTESPYFGQVSGLTQDLDHLYQDLLANDALTNFKKYSSLAWKFVTEKVFQVLPYGKEVSDITTELWEQIKQLKELETIQTIIKKYEELEANVQWLADELQLEMRLHQLWTMMRNKMNNYAQTALETDDRYREAKTKFIFDPDNGIMELEQKLPMSWHAFNETPKFDEIPEYKMLSTMPNMFSLSNFTLWGYIYNLRMNLDPKMWLPPYKSRSLLINSRHFMTFDGELVSLDFRYDFLTANQKPNQCSYLLSRDYLSKNFTLVLEPSIFKQQDELIATRRLTLLLKNLYLEIDIVGGIVRINRNITSTLPVYMDNAVIYMDSDVLVVESENDFVLNCNLQFDICWFDVGGWYFGQTAGLLGTINNERFDDYTTPNGQIAEKDNDFAKAWTIKECQERGKPPNVDYSPEIRTICDEFFRTTMLENCFPVINPVPFYDMCLDLGVNSISTVLKNDHPSERGACSAALAYIEACNAMKVPLRIPDKCVHCELINGSYVPEGTFMRLEDHLVPKTTDVVFIVEAKDCNKNLTAGKSMMAVVNSLQKELSDANLTNNRYAVVAFGGRLPYDKPRSVVFNKEVFTDSNLIKHYFEHITFGGGTNNDIFQAISFAAKLLFRPGASKTFILIPCSKCVSSDMKLDYSSLLQLMLEEGINLHLLLEHGFEFDKPRFKRIVYGIDRNLAYSKDSVETLRGDQDIRKQFKMPKDGLCIPLAIETNGSVFAARKLKPEKRNPVKKVARVFAKRVAKSATPSTCQLCECTGHNTGVAYMTCTTCHTSDGVGGDYDFDETFQGFDLDWDGEIDEGDY